jgi:hypothetical protein
MLWLVLCGIVISLRVLRDSAQADTALAAE